MGRKSARVLLASHDSLCRFSNAVTYKTSQEFDDCLAVDARRLRSMARDLRHLYGERRDALLPEFNQKLESSQAAVSRRKERLPKPKFQNDLPVNEKRQDIAELIQKHQVVIICGETGSGKTTQIPQICLEIGRGTRGLIGHTQPRRIAARSTASRIAQELETELGHLVGYKIRFNDRVSDDTYIKVMTDGILLAETQGDPWLGQYDTLILDEAHERSLNIDFLLGYLRQLLVKRPDLKLIITSATIDASRFAKHFARDGQDAPVIEVSGRLYPVEVRYRPVCDEEVDDETERDLYDAIVDACDELIREGAGDILVFLPGEREIREATEALRKNPPGHLFRDPPDILPLFARLSLEDQSRIFRSANKRRIILATNVAETSLTVPGIRYVVDTGLARVKRYSYRNKVEQLQIEHISQASANQRSGRCGRVSAGVCIRLYAEEDYQQRPRFADPEILRSSLAGVILRMKSLRLGSIEDFPFVDAPPPKAITDGYQLLIELGAVTEEYTLTRVGQELAKMPVDPRVGRMIVAAKDEGCLREMLVIAAALSVQDPRERPQDKPGSADMAHKKFHDDKSEFLSWLKLWDWYAQARVQNKSQRKLAHACHDNFLSALRMREWVDIHHQLTVLVRELSWKENQVPATYQAVHLALLTGLLGNIGSKSEDSAHYLGARGIKYLIHPGSSLHKKAGKWIVASEITETSKLFARCIARIEPEWLEKIGAHLIKRSWFDPHWEKKAMQAVAYERSVLYGVVINPKKRVSFAPIDPVQAREIFIRQGLVGGEIGPDYEKKWKFYRHNQQLILDIEMLEHKSRRPDVLVDDELIFAFYDRVVPEDTCDGVSFDHWLRQDAKTHDKLLTLAREDLMRHEAAGITTEAFPQKIRLGGNEYELVYHFEPGSSKDGVSLTLPLAQLNQIPADACEWLVPGLIKEKVVHLIKTLPQKIRSKLVPVPEFAAQFVDETVRPDGSGQLSSAKPLISTLIRYILNVRGLNARGWEITPDAFRPDALPSHFFFNFRLIDEHGRLLAQSRHLNDLRRDWGSQARQEFSEYHETPSEYVRVTSWCFGELPELMNVDLGNGLSAQSVSGFPALRDEGESVSLDVFDTPDEARKTHAKGLLRLFSLQFKEQIKYFEKNLPGLVGMSMQYMPLGSAEDLKHQLIDLTLTRACLQDPWPVNEEAFNKRCADAKPRLGLLSQEICRLVAQILTDWQAVQKKIGAYKAHREAVEDINQQIERLINKRFVIDTPFDRLQHFPRYLKAISLRLDKLKNDPARDRRLMAEFMPLWANYAKRFALISRQGVYNPQLEQFRWLLEELRVQLFAQELKTPAPVSTKRLQKMWEGLR